jgi:AraC-like DNA-binding protein
MEITFDFITVIYLAAALFGTLSSLVIFYFGIKANPANQPLAIGQLLASLAIVVGFSLVSKLILHWPFLYRLGTPLLLAFIPMTFLHVVFYTRNRHWKWYDILHSIPLLIFLVDYGHVLLLPNAEKLVIIQQEINDLNLLGEFRQSKYFGPRFHQEFRTVLYSAYWVAQVVILVKWLKSQTSLTPQNKVWKNWIIVFLGCQFFMWFPFYLSFFGMEIMTTYHIVNSFSVAWLLVSSLSLFFFPSLLYGTGLAGPSISTRIVRVLRKTETTEAEVKKLEEYMQIIECQMGSKMFFLKAGYSISDFSRDINVPVYQISKSLNKFKGCGFVDFINQERIRYCIYKFDHGEWLNFTLEAVAIECGFSNRNSFTKYFKKFKDCSPSEYRDAQQSRILRI